MDLLSPLVELISHVRRLQVLESIAACGSFSGAADALQMTQSAVSQHVATLERAIDMPLIERGTRPVQLTDAGFALVRHARALIARIGNAEQELGEITGRRNGRLRFGSFPTALATFVPAALARFQRQHADVSLTVIDDHLQRLLPGSTTANSTWPSSMITRHFPRSAHATTTASTCSMTPSRPCSRGATG